MYIREMQSKIDTYESLGGLPFGEEVLGSGFGSWRGGLVWTPGRERIPAKVMGLECLGVSVLLASCGGMCVLYTGSLKTGH